MWLLSYRFHGGPSTGGGAVWEVDTPRPTSQGGSGSASTNKQVQQTLLTSNLFAQTWLQDSLRLCNDTVRLESIRDRNSKTFKGKLFIHKLES